MPIVHLAALPSVPRSVLDPVASHHANATGTLEVLQAARRAGDLHVVVASSSSVYGANRELPKREGMRTAPISPYAVSKQATEAYAMSFGHTYGLPTLAFRFFNVYGPLQPAGHAYAAVVPAFVDAALRGVPLTIHGDGEQTRDFTNVGTVTRVLADAVTRTVTDLGAGEPRVRHPHLPQRPRRPSSPTSSASPRRSSTSSRAPATCATRRPTTPGSATTSPTSSPCRCARVCSRPSTGSGPCPTTGPSPCDGSSTPSGGRSAPPSRCWPSG